jgi:hypothetical protein
MSRRLFPMHMTAGAYLRSTLNYMRIRSQ